MSYAVSAKNLNDSDAEVCGKCSNCNPLSTFKLKNKGLISKATKFLKGKILVLRLKYLDARSV